MTQIKSLVGVIRHVPEVCLPEGIAAITIDPPSFADQSDKDLGLPQDMGVVRQPGYLFVSQKALTAFKVAIGREPANDELVECDIDMVTLKNPGGETHAMAVTELYDRSMAISHLVRR